MHLRVGTNLFPSLVPWGQILKTGDFFSLIKWPWETGKLALQITVSFASYTDIFQVVFLLFVVSFALRLLKFCSKLFI